MYRSEPLITNHGAQSDGFATLEARLVNLESFLEYFIFFSYMYPLQKIDLVIRLVVNRRFEV